MRIKSIGNGIETKQQHLLSLPNKSKKNQNSKEMTSYLKNQAIAFKQLRSSGIDLLRENVVWSILQVELGLEYAEIINADITTEAILEAVHSHIKKNGYIVGEINFDIHEDDVEWIPFVSNQLEKARVAHDGQVWTIHQNDADPHPSNPHAHNYAENLKLDLYAGGLYQNKRLVCKMKRKALNELVKKIKSSCPNIIFRN